MNDSDVPKVDIGAVLEHYARQNNAEYAINLPPPGMGWRRVRCPFHDDSHASASVNRKLNAFNCHQCGMKGDSLKIIERMEGVKFADACRFAERELAAESGRVRGSVGRQQRYRPSWL